MKRGAQAFFASIPLVALAALSGFVDACSSSSGDVGGAGGLDASSDTQAPPVADAGTDGATTAPPNPACLDAGTPASTLECTGLYADFATKTIATTAIPYAPATPLWADGAGKLRWIQLPPGTTIDTTDPNEWTFPVGTKVWKEFAVGGKRVETRLFQKITATFWVRATYEWNADDSQAPISFGDTVPVGDDGGTWTIPTPDECDECHRGRSDRILGFEQVGLGLPGATGLTLAQLASQGLLSPVPANVNLTIGDDGTGKDGPALAWLHVNCGVTCHNSNEGSTAYGAGMLLRLDPTVLDGRPAVGWDPQRTTIGVLAVSGQFAGETRIIPGDATDSVLPQLISERGAVQMPPIATNFVDTPDVASVVAWINALPNDAGIPDDGGHPHGPDAGPDAGDDAGEDAGEDGGTDASDGSVDEDAAPLDATADAPIDSAIPDAAVDAGD